MSIKGDYILATTTDASNNTSEFSNCQPVITNYYWVGGEGNWNDAAHWSENSGGTGGIGVPGLYTNVYIDDNSGTNSTIVIHIPGPAVWYTKGFYMSGINGSKTPIIGKGTLLPRPNGPF